MSVNQGDRWLPGLKVAQIYVTEGFPNESPRNLDYEIENSEIYTDGKVETVSEDSVDLLPKDTFGMDISATITAFTGLVEDMNLNNFGFESDEDEGENSANSFHDADLGDFDEYFTPFYTTTNYQGCTKSYVDSVPGPPPDALTYALRFLGLRDLLTVESVCKSLRNDVITDTLLWKNFHIDYTLKDKITDDALIRLTNRAQGTLHSLSLVNCTKITDLGLRRVLESNPGLTKLNVARCTRLGIEGIMSNLRFFKSFGRPGIQRLRIAWILGVTSEHFEELKFLLGIQNQEEQQQERVEKQPRFFQVGQYLPFGDEPPLSFDDEREIDIEICPRCQKVRPVYDCPADGCKGKVHTSQACRACKFCISRCSACGRCLGDREYEETFDFDLVCGDCVKAILNLPVWICSLLMRR